MKIDFNVPENLNFYAHVVTDIAMIAHRKILSGEFDCDSFTVEEALNETIADCAKDFVTAWETLRMYNRWDIGYSEVIDDYADMKLNEFFENASHARWILKTRC